MVVKTTEKKQPVHHKKKEETEIATKPESEKKVIKKLPYLYAVGRRKTAIARVRLYPKDDRGLIQVNGKDYLQYFPDLEFQKKVEEPLKIANFLNKNYLSIKVSGGGKRSQAEAVVHGLARILVKYDESNKKALRGHGLLTRDSRKKERKKPGLKRARRAPQWQKR